MKLLLTGAYNWQDNHLSLLKNMGWDILYTEREDQSLEFNVSDIDAVICNWLFQNHSIENFQKLKYIQLLSAGLDRVPLDYIKKNNIKLFNARGVYSVPIAEYVLCGVLQLYKNSQIMRKNQKEHKWEKLRTIRELYGKRISIIGTGSVGCEIAKKFSVFTDEIYGMDLYPSSKPFMKEVISISLLDEEICKSDVVILTLPLTNETRGMFNEAKFNKMKEFSVFVNVARGGLVKEKDLSVALDTKLFGAVVDVFESEPLSKESDLWDKDNLIISPHNSFISENNDLRMWDVILKNLNTNY